MEEEEDQQNLTKTNKEVRDHKYTLYINVQIHNLYNILTTGGRTGDRDDALIYPDDYNNYNDYSSPNEGDNIYTFSISSSTLTIMCGLIGLLLLANIILIIHSTCSSNKRRGYKPVKFVDSDSGIESDAKRLNV